ncbi:hypothetical protein DMH04_33230 [Kibdelosporangium aridum]|uniref:Uncharacterized protein n=1 Tax=Kibdelosporangium aridum TaxID=2030 RepID=A0A428Z0Z3_KIBAR|nr:hypothetical protein [Kibdelosporangium aridum]RSM78529.1 hypothetical protein DMH04_33230 [Kibdelosporangium aridum]
MAKRCHLIAMRLARTSGNLRHEAQAWAGLGRALVTMGETAKAIRRFTRSLELYQRMNDRAAPEMERLIASLRR